MLVINDSKHKVLGYIPDSMCPQKAFRVDVDFKSPLLSRIIDIDKAYYMNNSLYILCECDKNYISMLPKVGDTIDYTFSRFKEGLYE